MFEPLIIPSALSDGRRGLAQALIEAGRDGPLRAAQVMVAGAQRQPVPLAHGGLAHDLNGQMQALNEAPDHEQLLIIFFTEDGNIGPDDVKQLQHHGRHSLEVAGPELAAVDRVQGGQRHLGRRLAGAVDLRHRRDKRQIDSMPPQQGQIGLGR